MSNNGFLTFKYSILELTPKLHPKLSLLSTELFVADLLAFIFLSKKLIFGHFRLKNNLSLFFLLFNQIIFKLIWVDLCVFKVHVLLRVHNGVVREIKVI